MSSNPRTIRVGAVQMENADGDKERNFAKIEQFCERASARGVQLLVFPECCVHGYWFIRNLTPQQIAHLAEPFPDGPSTQRLIALARRYQMSIGAGWLETGLNGVFHNSYVVALPDGSVHRHRKLQAFEHECVASGEEFTLFDLPQGFRATTLICFDNNINENGRMTALLGADIVIAPHQTGGCRTTNPHLMGAIERCLWDNRHRDAGSIEREFTGDKGRGWLLRWLPSRAHDNGVFLIFANGVGVDDDEIRTGNAMILDPYGRIIAETWRAEDDMVVADLDGELLARATGRAWITARRPELYGLLAQPTGRERDTRTIRFEE